MVSVHGLGALQGPPVWGEGKTRKVLAKDTSQAMQVTATSCARLALQLGCSPSAAHELGVSNRFENKSLHQ